jgi:hypothetical protein
MGRAVQAGESALVVPENYCVTAFDVNSHPQISNAAAGEWSIAFHIFVIVSQTKCTL